MKQVIIAALVVFVLMNASNLVVVTYNSDRNTKDWEWNHETSRLQVLIGFEEEQWLNELQSLELNTDNLRFYDSEKEIPILVYLGECPSGGYAVNIDRIYKENENTVIAISRRSPGPGEYVTMAFTYPYDFLLIPRKDLINDNIVVIDQTGTLLVEYTHAFPNEERQMRKITVYY